jgi:hypothetical protein
MEVDIVFPREGGLYYETELFPIIIAVQNPAIAYHFGYHFSWTIDSEDDSNSDFRWGEWFFLDSKPLPTDNPHFELDSIGPLDSGVWIFEWPLSLPLHCVEWALRVDQYFSDGVTNGSFNHLRCIIHPEHLYPLDHFLFRSVSRFPAACSKWSSSYATVAAFAVS